MTSTDLRQHDAFFVLWQGRRQHDAPGISMFTFSVYYYDVTNVEVQRHRRKSEFTFVAVIVALSLI